jgi:hypothetical protein
MRAQRTSLRGHDQAAHQQSTPGRAIERASRCLADERKTFGRVSKRFESSQTLRLMPEKIKTSGDVKELLLSYQRGLK